MSNPIILMVVNNKLCIIIILQLKKYLIKFIKFFLKYKNFDSISCDKIL